MEKMEREELNRKLSFHMSTVQEALQGFDMPSSSSSSSYSLSKVGLEEVVNMGERVSRQATIYGMLWDEGGSPPETSAVEENMAAFFNLLLGLVLVSHGSLVSAGPTMSSLLLGSVDRVCNSGFRLFKETVASYGNSSVNTNGSIPKLVGIIWDACAALKEAPKNDGSAVGIAMGSVVVSLEGVLREIRSLGPGQEGGAAGRGADSDSDDLGRDLSGKEMRVARAAAALVAGTVEVQKELISAVSGGTKDGTEPAPAVGPMDALLRRSEEVSELVDEIGASLYPPQEAENLRKTAGAMKLAFERMNAEVAAALGGLDGSAEPFNAACDAVMASLAALELETRS